MAKRKTRTSRKKKNLDIYNSIYGLILILIAILGIGKYGPVGRFIASVALFFVGNLYFFLLIAIFIIGVYLIINREEANLVNSKMIGITLMVIALLTFMHQKYAIDNNSSEKIFSETIDYLMDGANKIMNKEVKPGIFNPALSNTGGGILGALFITLFYAMFDSQGAEIVTWILFATGILIFTGLSVKDIIDKGKDVASNMSSRSSKDGDDDEYDNEPTSKVKIVDRNEEKKVVHDIKELTNENKEEVKSENKPALDNSTNKNYVLPPMDLLELGKKKNKMADHSAVEKNIEILEQVLRDFGITGKVVEVNIGPTVTQYELSIASGTRVSKILTINKEISLALAKKDVRIQAPIPGKSTVGIEMPNDEAQMVTLRETLELMPDQTKKDLLSVALGKDIMGKVKWCRINKTPHLLVAGATGSGKSVCINDIIISILMKAKPDEVKLVLVDPKKVELGMYTGVPHLLIPVVTDPRKASIALKKAVVEMERRYDVFEENKTKNIESYNDLVEKKNQKLPEEEKLQKMPYIVVIVDELADLMLVAGKEVEDSIMRITQMARAAGIHLIIATQRPSTDVITGIIKANIPSRISFAVSSQIDSRTILDMAGAEKLLGKGDMLFLPMGESQPERIQGAFVSEAEIQRVINYTVSQQKASYDSNFNLDAVDQDIKQNTVSGEPEEYDDPLYNEIVEFVIETQKASASLLQRRFKLGYNRAARIIDLLEERGIVGPQNGSKPREVLVQLEKDNKEE